PQGLFLAALEPLTQAVHAVRVRSRRCCVAVERRVGRALEGELSERGDLLEIAQLVGLVRQRRVDAAGRLLTSGQQVLERSVAVEQRRGGLLAHALRPRDSV